MRSFRLRVENNVENGGAFRAEKFFTQNIYIGTFSYKTRTRRVVLFARSSRFGSEADVAACPESVR